MKKILIGFAVASSIILSGCFGNSDSSKPSDKKIEGFHVYATEEFEMQIPDEWEIFTPDKFASNISKNTLIAFRNNVKNEKFTANVVVIKNELMQEQEISTSDYAKSLRQKMSQDLSSYSEILTEQPKIFINGKENETVFLYASGRQQPEGELKNFMQISAVKAKTAYIALGAFLENDSKEVAKKIETMIRSFEVK
ncbi:hypothetical protein HZC21_00840 [Candidatus Peregrinibacteria bacterium]|nr:hypothetical protein [Candidatus Peregrinibacteria bacterium]